METIIKDYKPGCRGGCDMGGPEQMLEVAVGTTEPRPEGVGVATTETQRPLLPPLAVPRCSPPSAAVSQRLRPRKRRGGDE